MRAKSLVFIAMSMATAVAFAGEACLDNYSSEGSLLSGSTYKTWATLPNISTQDAFSRAVQFTATNGFTILSSNKDTGTISAAQTNLLAKGKTVPLTITLANEGNSTRINISYSLGIGQSSPESAIKSHFCGTVAAAMSGPTNMASSKGERSSGRQTTTATMPGFASISDEQKQAIIQAIPKTAPNDKVRKVVTDAMPTIAEFLEKVSCMNDYNSWRQLNAYAAPGVTFQMTQFPIAGAHYHDKASCMTVSRVQGWVMPANNALRFEVVYKADDSGEVSKMAHEAVKQPDGAWLFNRFY